MSPPLWWDSLMSPFSVDIEQFVWSYYFLFLVTYFIIFAFNLLVLAGVHPEKGEIHILDDI